MKASTFGAGIGIDWDVRYKRAVLDFVKAPVDIDMDTVTIDYAPGYTYGGDTGPIEESMSIRWVEGPTRKFANLEESDIFNLIKSFPKA